jgi:hypothetical protein
MIPVNIDIEDPRLKLWGRFDFGSHTTLILRETESILYTVLLFNLEQKGVKWPILKSVYLSVCLSIYLSIYLSICGSAALVDLGRFFSFLIYTQSVGLLGRGSARRKNATYTHNNTNTE